MGLLCLQRYVIASIQLGMHDPPPHPFLFLPPFPPFRAFIPSLLPVPSFHPSFPCLHSIPPSRAFIPSLLPVPSFHPSFPCLHSIPPSRAFIPSLLPVPSFHPSFPCLHSIPPSRAFIPSLLPVPSFHPSFPCLYSIPPSRAFIPSLLPVPSFHPSSRAFIPSLLPVPSFHPSSLVECDFADVPSSDSQHGHVSTNGGLPDQPGVIGGCGRKNCRPIKSNCRHPGHHSCYPGDWICQLSNRDYYHSGKCPDIQVSHLHTRLHQLADITLFISSPSHHPARLVQSIPTQGTTSSASWAITPADSSLFVTVTDTVLFTTGLQSVTVSVQVSSYSVQRLEEPAAILYRGWGN